MQSEKPSEGSVAIRRRFYELCDTSKTNWNYTKIGHFRRTVFVLFFFNVRKRLRLDRNRLTIEINYALVKISTKACAKHLRQINFPSLLCVCVCVCVCTWRCIFGFNLQMPLFGFNSIRLRLAFDVTHTFCWNWILWLPYIRHISGTHFEPLIVWVDEHIRM